MCGTSLSWFNSWQFRVRKQSKRFKTFSYLWVINNDSNIVKFQIYKPQIMLENIRWKQRFVNLYACSFDFMGLHFRPVNCTVNTTNIEITSKYHPIIMRLFVNNSQGLVAVSRSKPVDDNNGKYTQVSGQNNDGKYRAQDDGRYHPSSQQEGISALQLCFYPTVPNACWSRRKYTNHSCVQLCPTPTLTYLLTHTNTHTHSLTLMHLLNVFVFVLVLTTITITQPNIYLYRW